MEHHGRAAVLATAGGSARADAHHIVPRLRTLLDFAAQAHLGPRSPDAGTPTIRTDPDAATTAEAMKLHPDQAVIISALERVGGALSLVGVLFILVTFVTFRRLRTVPNHFIVFASIANIGASAASMIGLAGIEAGVHSPLCHAQAFLLEM